MPFLLCPRQARKQKTSPSSCLSFFLSCFLSCFLSFFLFLQRSSDAHIPRKNKRKKKKHETQKRQDTQQHTQVRKLLFVCGVCVCGCVCVRACGFALLLWGPSVCCLVSCQLWVVRGQLSCFCFFLGLHGTFFHPPSLHFIAPAHLSHLRLSLLAFACVRPPLSSSLPTVIIPGCFVLRFAPS